MSVSRGFSFSKQNPWEEAVTEIWKRNGVFKSKKSSCFRKTEIENWAEFLMSTTLHYNVIHLLQHLSSTLFLCFSAYDNFLHLPIYSYHLHKKQFLVFYCFVGRWERCRITFRQWYQEKATQEKSGWDSRFLLSWKTLSGRPLESHVGPGWAYFLFFHFQI